MVVAQEDLSSNAEPAVEEGEACPSTFSPFDPKNPRAWSGGRVKAAVDADGVGRSGAERRALRRLSTVPWCWSRIGSLSGGRSPVAGRFMTTSLVGDQVSPFCLALQMARARNALPTKRGVDQAGSSVFLWRGVKWSLGVVGLSLIAAIASR